MRIFIACEIPDRIRSILSEYIRDLDKTIRGVKWERPEKIHLTLRFLGETSENRVKEITDVLEGPYNTEKPDVRLSSPGAFPDLRRPRVLFVGIERSERLESLKNEVDDRLQSIGIEPEDRSFSPHLTVGRVKKQEKIRPELPAVEKEGFVFDSFTLFRSELKKSGSVHIPLKNFDL